MLADLFLPFKKYRTTLTRLKHALFILQRKWFYLFFVAVNVILKHSAGPVPIRRERHSQRRSSSVCRVSSCSHLVLILSKWKMLGKEEKLQFCTGTYVVLCVQTGPGAHPASCTTGSNSPLPRGRPRPGRDADHSPTFRSTVKKE
jgi:hypothetical protein